MDVLLRGIGAHRYYIGKVGTGILYTFTGGLLGIGVLVDVFTLDGQVIAVNEKNSVAPTLRRPAKGRGGTSRQRRPEKRCG